MVVDRVRGNGYYRTQILLTATVDKYQETPIKLANCAVILATHPQIIKNISDQLVYQLGLDVTICETESRFKQLIHDGENISIAIADLAMDEIEFSDILQTLEQSSIPTISLFDRQDDCPRASYKNIIASLDRDAPEQLAEIGRLTNIVFENNCTRVLLIQGNSQKKGSMQELLEDHYYAVSSAADAAEAMEQLRLYPETQLLLIDEKSSAIGGIDVIDILRKNYTPENLSIMGVAIQHNSRVISKMFHSGANDVITTSTEGIEVLARVRSQTRAVNQFRRINQHTYTDEISLAYTLNYFKSVGEKIYANALRGNIQLGLALVNIDNFKAINEQYGSEVGDRVLRFVAAKLIALSRAGDIVARKSGDEFLCLVSGVGRNNVKNLFERVRQEIHHKGFWYANRHIKLSVTIGVGCDAGTGLDTLCRRVEMAMHAARKEGKNMIAVV
jgi:diguanylate cyclase (GGDEF)-like protein